jgi:hypothetical protein
MEMSVKMLASPYYNCVAPQSSSQGIAMKPILVLAACLLLLTAPVAFSAADARNWQSCTLLETEKQEVKQSTTKTNNTEGTAKDKGNKTDYSQTTTTTSDDVDTFQVYTIQGGTKTYVVR